MTMWILHIYSQIYSFFIISRITRDQCFKTLWWIKCFDIDIDEQNYKWNQHTNKINRFEINDWLNRNNKWVILTFLGQLVLFGLPIFVDNYFSEQNEDFVYIDQVH